MSSRKNEILHCLLSAEACAPLRDGTNDESENFYLRTVHFLFRKEVETYRGISI